MRIIHEQEMAHIEENSRREPDGHWRCKHGTIERGFCPLCNGVVKNASPWIRTSPARLTHPKEGAEVLFAVRGWTLVAIGVWQGETWKCNTGHDINDVDVTHWMPAPALPPKEERDAR